MVDVVTEFLFIVAIVADGSGNGEAEEPESLLVGLLFGFLHLLLAQLLLGLLFIRHLFLEFSSFFGICVKSVLIFFGRRLYSTRAGGTIRIKVP